MQIVFSTSQRQDIRSEAEDPPSATAPTDQSLVDLVVALTEVQSLIDERRQNHSPLGARALVESFLATELQARGVMVSVRAPVPPTDLWPRPPVRPDRAVYRTSGSGATATWQSVE